MSAIISNYMVLAKREGIFFIQPRNLSRRDSMVNNIAGLIWGLVLFSSSANPIWLIHSCRFMATPIARQDPCTPQISCKKTANHKL